MVAPIIAALARQTVKNKAKKTVKDAAKKTVKKQPRPKTDTDERYNERRRARRAAERLERQAREQRGAIQEATLREANALREVIENSYIDKNSKQYRQTLEEFKQLTRSGREYDRKIREQNRKLSAAENNRRNKMQENYFKRASKTISQKEAGLGYTNEQKFIRQEQSAFYAATRILWLGGDSDRINENIVAGLKGVRLSSGKPIQNLQDAFEFIKEQYPDKFPTMEDVVKGKYNTQDYGFGNEIEEESTSIEPISRRQWAQLGIKVY